MRIPEGVVVSTLRVRVGYVDTDRAQVVHHATYLRYLEAARVEHLRERGIDYKSFELQRGLSLPVVDDELDIRTWIGFINRAKLRFDSLICRGRDVLSIGEITLACVKQPEGKLCSMPDFLIALGPSSAPSR
jgi:acyl-CoA thioester hydrolase